MWCLWESRGMRKGLHSQCRIVEDGLFCSTWQRWEWTAYRAVTGEKGTALACRDQEHGGTLWIQCCPPVLYLMGLDQVNAEQSQSCLACRAQQEEQWTEKTSSRWRTDMGMGKESHLWCFRVFCWHFLVELSLIGFPTLSHAPHLQHSCSTEELVS